MLDIRPHAAIVEGELAEQLGVGRTPVREALKRLEVERLVVSYPRRGTFATGVDVADLGHISEIRSHLEPVAARRAAELSPDGLRKELIYMADRTDRVDVTQVGRSELLRWDLTVHRAIYDAARNPHLSDVLRRYDNLATRIFCMFLDRLPTVAAHVGEHGPLLRAIAAGDGEKAAQPRPRPRHRIRGGDPNGHLGAGNSVTLGGTGSWRPTKPTQPATSLPMTDHRY